jgi:hypothetical protein
LRFHWLSRRFQVVFLENLPTVARELHTSEEIRDEVARLVNRGRPVPLVVPLPIPAIRRDSLEGGANWEMPRFPAHKGNELPIERAILNVKLRWNLASDPWPDTTPRSTL